MTARENAETADLTLEVERLRGELERTQDRLSIAVDGRIYDQCAEALAASESKVQSLTEQLAEATGLLREAIVVGPMGWHLRLDAFLSRAPAQAAEPTVQELANTFEKLSDGYLARAESAESKLARVSEHIGYFAQDVAAARKNREPQTGMHVPYHGPFCSAVPSVIRDLERQVRSLQEALLAPSQGEGGGGNG